MIHSGKRPSFRSSACLSVCFCSPLMCLAHFHSHAFPLQALSYKQGHLPTPQKDSGSEDMQGLAVGKTISFICEKKSVLRSSVFV